MQNSIPSSKKVVDKDVASSLSLPGTSGGSDSVTHLFILLGASFCVQLQWTVQFPPSTFPYQVYDCQHSY